MASLVICMAGLNTRFHDVGFDIPKYLLPWGDETIIHSILKNLGEFDDVVLLANKRDEYFKNFRPFFHYVDDVLVQDISLDFVVNPKVRDIDHLAVRERWTAAGIGPPGI